MKQSELLRKQADMMDMSEKYGVDDWRKLVKVTNTDGAVCELITVSYMFSECANPKFAIGVVEGKPVFEGDALYDENGFKHYASIGMKFTYQWSLNPPKPKTVMVELLREDAELSLSWPVPYGETTAVARIQKACRKALEESCTQQA